MKRLSVILLLSSFGLTVFGQESAQEGRDNGYDTLSTKMIHVSDIMWKKKIWRYIDLREQQNRPLMSKNREFPKCIIEAAKEGVIQPYATDSLDRPIELAAFLKAMEIPSEEVQYSEEELAFLANEDGGGDDWSDDEDSEGDDESDAPAASSVEYFFPSQLYSIQLKEKLIFDKQRSVMYYDIIAVSLVVPPDHPDNIKGIELPIASFSYKELSEKVFANNPDAIWFNPYNDAEHRNLADAFELRLFSSYIAKVSNPDDEFLVDIYGGDPYTGIMASEWKAFELLEFEHNLWEF